MNPSINSGLKERVTFGFWVYLMSDCVLFASLFATYAVLGGQTFGGATIYDIFNLQFVLIETLLLLTSSFTVGLSLLFATRNKKRAALVTLAATLVLGSHFLRYGSERV
jgi:cytochrome o ubiquinol oxidase subunit 3